MDGSRFYGLRSTDPFTRVPGGWAEVEVGLRPAGDDDNGVIVWRLSLNAALRGVCCDGLIRSAIGSKRILSPTLKRRD